MTEKLNSLIFQPIRGSEENINRLPKHDGFVYFAYDSGNIYMDKNDERFLMGSSSSGFFWCNGSSMDIVKASDDDSDTTYTIAFKALENDILPKKDSLILNVDGRFFRVKLIDKINEKIYANLIAVSGSGSGSGSGGQVINERDVDITWDNRTIAQGNTYVYGQSYNAVFTPITTAPGDINCTVTFKIFDREHNIEKEPLVQTGRSGAKMYFDTSNLPKSNNITLQIIVTSDNAQYNNGLGYQRNITSLRCVEIGIKKPYDDSYNALVKANDLMGTLALQYMPTGDTSIPLTLHAYVDGTELSDLKQLIPSSYYGRVVTVSIPRQSHGVHDIAFSVSATLNNQDIYTEQIHYQGAWARANDDTPIIWIGKYDKKVINYENSYIYYMVFDPINYANGLPAEVHLYKESAEVSQINTNYSDDGWLIWDISNLYEIGDNNFSISCRTTKVDLSINVTTEGSRDLNLEDESALLVNLTAAGRSSDEISSQRNLFKSTVNADTINVNLNNFNWQNNGWVDSEGIDKNGVDSGSFLSIANGSSMQINLGSGGISLNQQKNYTIEMRFRVRNIQEYSTLIRVIPKYFYDVPDAESETGWSPTYTRTEKDGDIIYTGPSLFEDEIIQNGWRIGVDEEYGNQLMDEKNTIKEANISSGVVVKWLDSKGQGFCIGTQEAYFKTPSDIANVRYCEDEIINISMVISKTDSLCYIYLNGILSGVCDLPSGTGSEFIINAPIEFNSQYCDFDLYRFRFYETGLTMPKVIHNYLSDMHSIKLYDQNQITDPLDPTGLSYELLLNYNETHPDELSMPYAVWEITDGKDDLLPWKKGDNRIVTVTFVNPVADRLLDLYLNGDTQNGIDEWTYYTHCPSYVAIGADINVQGTSSQKYPRRNYKIKFKNKKAEICEQRYTKGSLAGLKMSDSHTVLDKDGNPHTLSKKFHMDVESYGIDKFTWKIDFMESSESYNSGFANLMGNKLHPLYSKHPLNDYNLNLGNLDTKELRTSIYGFPVLTFHKYTRGNNAGKYEYIGKYIKNVDKGANESYGYELSITQPYVAQRTRKVPEKIDGQLTGNYIDEIYQPTVKEIAECWDVRDNKGNWCSFKYPNASARAQGFMTYQEGTYGENAKLEVFKHFEPRYSFFQDQIEAGMGYTAFEDPNTLETYSTPAQINQYLYDKYSNLEILFNWLDSTDQNTATNNNLATPVVYTTSSYVTDDLSIDYEIILTNVSQVAANTSFIAYTVDNKGNQIPIQYYIKKNDNYWYYKYDINHLSEEEIANMIQPEDWESQVAAGNIYTAIFSGLYKATFTKDTKEYRRQKYRAEFNDHLDKEYCLTYFVLTELLLCYDSRGKNLQMASYGPKRVGGDYIWYPCFYDIDTQLGLNNSGAYLWDYDADVTKNNLFSTPTSVLWVNLFDVFYDDIVQKYRVLRGISNPTNTEDSAVNGSLTQQNIIGAYEYTPEVFGSYAMQGVRPIIAIGLDEYYKYMAPALRENDYTSGKLYAGYYDTSGTHRYQEDGPTYAYCAQGDKKLTTKLLIRNRLNYIDSWWLGGDYRAGVVENQIFIRANANHSSTSDLFLDSEILDNIPTTGQGKGFSLRPYPVEHFDARPGAKIKPFLHQYVSYFADDYPSIPVKYDGDLGQEDGVWTNADTSALTAFKTEPDVSQQITYIPGGDYISSLGDISLMYPNSLQIFHGQRMLDLNIGSDYFGYKNPLLTKDSDWSLDSMPLLKSVNISNLNMFDREMNFTQSKKLREFRALGSILQRVNFAGGAPLDTVHLPSTMNTISFIKNKNLDTILTSKPEDTETHNLLHTPGLYIEGVTDYSPFMAGTGHNISTYEVDGGNLGYNSYIILKNLYDLKNGASQNEILGISLTDVEWTPYIQVEYGTEYQNSISYYLLNDHSTFETFNFVDTNDWNNKLLNGQIYIYNSKYTKEQEENTIMNLDLLDNFIINYETAKENGTISQFRNISGDATATIPTITGNLYVANDETNKINEAELTSKYKKYFPNLNIYAKNIQIANISKYIKIYENGKIETIAIERTDDVYPLQPKGNKPTQTHYDFIGWSLDNPLEVDDPSIILIYNNDTDTYETTSAWDSLVFTENENIFTFYAIFIPHKYKITYRYSNNQLIEVIDSPYSTEPGAIALPSESPWLNESSLPLRETYVFLGYSDRPDGDIVDLSKRYCNRDMTLYTVFEQMSVDDVDYTDYFAIAESSVVYNDPNNQQYNYPLENTNNIGDEILEGIVLTFVPPTTKVLRGKVKIPSVWNGYQVIGLSNLRQQNLISHIFFEKNNNEIRFIEIECCKQMTNLKYFDFINLPLLRQIRNSAFYEVRNLGLVDSIGDPTISVLNSIGNSSFMASFSSAQRDSSLNLIRIPGSVQYFGSQAFTYQALDNRTVSLQIGDSNHFSQLEIDNTTSPVFNQGYFGANNGYAWNNIDFYTIRYTGNDIIKNNNGEPLGKLIDYFGILRDSQQALPNNFTIHTSDTTVPVIVEGRYQEESNGG